MPAESNNLYTFIETPPPPPVCSFLNNQCKEKTRADENNSTTLTNFGFKTVILKLVRKLTKLKTNFKHSTMNRNYCLHLHTGTYSHFLWGATFTFFWPPLYIPPLRSVPIYLQVYFTLIQSHFDYYCSVWDGLGETLSTKIQKLQNRAVRVITRSSYDTSASVLLNALQLDNLSLRRKKVKTSLKGICPYLQNTQFVILGIISGILNLTS